MATKVRLGRSPLAAGLVNDFVADVERQRMEILMVNAAHGILAGSLPGPHKDLFDRMLIAQAVAQKVPIVSNDSGLDGYGIQRMW